VDTRLSTTSWQAMKEQRERELYVSREADGLLKRLLDDSDDGARNLVLAVAGDGGLGKSTLLRRFQQVASERGACCAVSDHESAEAVPETLGHLAAQLRSQGAALKRFEDRYSRYQEQLHKLRSDPSAPLGMAGLVAGTVARIGLSALEEVPGGSIALSAVDRHELAKQAAAWTDFVAAKTKRAEDRRLVLEPESELGSLFLSDLQAVAKERRTILCFDTYEQTGSYLDAWLRAMIEGKYGEVPLTVRIVIAGRDELSRNAWAPYEWLLTRARLLPFTADQSRAYLTGAGISDAGVILDYHASTGGMPLLLATLAVAPVSDGSPPRSGAAVAVERFLDAIEDDAGRQAVIDAALPRLLNEETFDVAHAHPDVAHAHSNNPSSFEWLAHLPFVDEHPRGWIYHDVVRVHMLDLHRRLKPQRWAETHTRLSEYYERLYNQGAQSPTVESLELYAEHIYHLLCATPERLVEVLGDVILLSSKADHVPLVCAEAIREAGHATGIPQVVRWGELTREALSALHDEAWATTKSFFDELIALELSTPVSGVAHMFRALAAFEENEFEEAEADAAIALQASPEMERSATTIIATVRMFRGDLQAVFELAPGMLTDSSPLLRASALLTYGRFAEAASAADTLLNDDPENNTLLYLRGAALFRLGHTDRAARDIERAIEIDPATPDYRPVLARVYLALGRADDALIQADAALAARPQSPQFRSIRAEVLADLGRRPEALADASYAIEAWPHVYGYRLMRGRINARFGEHENAIADLEEALKLFVATRSPMTPDRADISLLLGMSRDQLGDAAGAVADLAHAVEIAEPAGGLTLRNPLIARAEVMERQHRHADAARDWHRALTLTESTYGSAHLQTARVQANLGKALVLSGDAAGALGGLSSVTTLYQQQEPDGPGIAGALYWLGRARAALNPPTAEEPLYRATRLYAQLGDGYRGSLATCMAMLGYVQFRLDRKLAARAMLEQALLLHRSLSGDYSPALCFTLRALGATLKALGESGAAAAALEWSLEANNDTDPDTTHVIETLKTLADLAPDPSQPPPAPLSHARAPLAHLRRRALAGADLSSDIRHAIATVTVTAEDADRSSTLPMPLTAAGKSPTANEPPGTQLIVTPDSGARAALAAYAERETALGPDLMRALERHVILVCLSWSLESARAWAQSPIDSTQKRGMLVSDFWERAVHYLFTVEVEVQGASGENTLSDGVDSRAPMAPPSSSGQIPLLGD
jgi:tetratricopeptide (TPR) repeat protein